MTQKTVVILLSDRRSGSTMVQEALCRHPEIQHVEYSPHTYFETHHWLKSACVLRQPSQLFSGGRRYQGYGSPAAARRYLIDCLKGNLMGFQVPGDDRSLIFDGWEALCDRFATPVFFEKSPQTIHHWAALELLLQWIESTQSEVRIIGLVRNPMAVMASAKKAFGTSSTERQFGWASGIRNLFVVRELLGPEKFRLVRYEDIVGCPAREFSSLCRFIGLESGEELGSEIHSASVAKWVEDPEFTLQLDDNVRRTASMLGYDGEELMNPHGETAPPTLNPGATFRRMRARLYQRLVKPLLLATWQKK